MSKRIVICGSMTFLNEMKSLKLQLEKKGIETYIPESDGSNFDELSPSEQIEIKREASRKHFNEINSSNTEAILVLNNQRKDRENYIGANAFAEIALSFFLKKKIFLLHDVYQFYEEELLAWEVEPLHGKLDKVISYFNLKPDD